MDKVFFHNGGVSCTPASKRAPGSSIPIQIQRDTVRILIWKIIHAEVNDFNGEFWSWSGLDVAYSVEGWLW